MSSDLFENNGAKFSRCGNYRYALWRIWDKDKPLVMFVGLNPSTANAVKNDRTISKVIRFALHWGYGGVYMLNCFAFISTDPKKLETLQDDLINDRWLCEIGHKCQRIIFAWGCF